MDKAVNTLIFLVYLVVVTFLIYTIAFYTFLVPAQHDDLHARYLGAINASRDPLTAAQMTAVETWMVNCRRSQLPGFPSVNIWIDPSQLESALQPAERSCVTQVLDRQVLSQPQATMALAAEMRRVGYPLSPAYERAAKADPALLGQALASLASPAGR